MLEKKVIINDRGIECHKMPLVSKLIVDAMAREISLNLSSLSPQ